MELRVPSVSISDPLSQRLSLCNEPFCLISNIFLVATAKDRTYHTARIPPFAARTPLSIRLTRTSAHQNKNTIAEAEDLLLGEGVQGVLPCLLPPLTACLPHLSSVSHLVHYTAHRVTFCPSTLVVKFAPATCSIAFVLFFAKVIFVSPATLLLPFDHPHCS